ncbi:hypothetical protein ERC79_22200 [Rhodococcus sp. ABRD24]|uniref:B-4DMT family transporter n=1 Tax=Rhodococcus sp. ABRD24 TaxID=2507582 RepID=UPI001040444D|nr:B-4DMT family transporter [Rhodococcus sp. ABRD24]QBJ98344.1 hypothetical protein ERC79_22200 [Rhodococcus sp. ABRD24]
MNGWVVRGLGLALVHVVVRTLLGAAVAQWPQQGGLMRWFSLVVVIIAALLWGGFDGIRDRRAHRDPEDGADLTMMWLKAALLGGVLAGAVAWLVGLILDITVTDGSLLFEVTSGAAFTVLLIFIPAMIAVALGRFLVGRESEQAHDHSGAYAHNADLQAEEDAAENYEGAEWSYEHGAGRDQANPEADNTETEVFAPVDPDGQRGGTHRSE